MYAYIVRTYIKAGKFAQRPAFASYGDEHRNIDSPAHQEVCYCQPSQEE